MALLIACTPQNQSVEKEIRPNQQLLSVLSEYVETIPSDFGERVLFLKIHSCNEDTVTYTLRSIIDNHELIDAYPDNSFKFGNILVFAFTGSGVLFGLDSVKKQKTDKLINENLDTSRLSAIYEPPVWRLNFIKDKIIVDSFWGSKEAEKMLIIPKHKFVPPSNGK